MKSKQSSYTFIVSTGYRFQQNGISPPPIPTQNTHQGNRFTRILLRFGLAAFLLLQTDMLPNKIVSLMHPYKLKSRQSAEDEFVTTMITSKRTQR